VRLNKAVDKANIAKSEHTKIQQVRPDCTESCASAPCSEHFASRHIERDTVSGDDVSISLHDIQHDDPQF
jgi:hypothetical protein